MLNDVRTDPSEQYDSVIVAYTVVSRKRILPSLLQILRLNILLGIGKISTPGSETET